jgi:hypothetical protein
VWWIFPFRGLRGVMECWNLERNTICIISTIASKKFQATGLIKSPNQNGRGLLLIYIK